MQWYVVQVTTQHENKVKNYLEKRKHDGFAGRIGRVIASEGELKGYVFIEADIWPELCLRGLTTRCRVIGTVDEEQVLKITGIEDAKSKSRFKEGDWVEIMTGPLTGLVGKIKKPGREKSKVTVDIFNEEIKIEIQNDALKLVKGDF